MSDFARIRKVAQPKEGGLPESAPNGYLVIHMKPGIHPTYEVTTIACMCGESVQMRSTAKNLKVEICSKCHPLFTGKWKFVDTAGRIEKFERKYAKKPAATGDAPAGPTAPAQAAATR